jgi:hypothetical protein
MPFGSIDHGYHVVKNFRIGHALAAAQVGNNPLSIKQAFVQAKIGLLKINRSIVEPS